MLCERCQDREASCHSTTVSEGTTTSIALCEECFQSSAEPAAREFFAAAKGARCRYYGGPPCCGGMDSFETLVESQQMNFLCMRCFNEFSRFCQQQLEHLPQDLPQQEQMVAIRALHDEADRHMRQWVSERGAR